MTNYIERYHPNLPSVFKHYTIDDNLSKEEYAFTAYKMLLVAKKNSDCLFLVIGKLLKAIRDEKLYETLDYESFNQFLSSEEIGFSREKAYLCIRAYEYLVEHLAIDPEKVGKLNIGRINMMIPVIKRVEKEEGREEAIKKIEDLDSLRHGDFVREIQTERKSSKPDVYWDDEREMWKVSYWENVTELFSKGIYEKEETEKSEA